MRRCSYVLFGLALVLVLLSALGLVSAYGLGIGFGALGLVTLARSWEVPVTGRTPRR